MVIYHSCCCYLKISWKTRAFTHILPVFVFCEQVLKMTRSQSVQWSYEPSKYIGRLDILASSWILLCWRLILPRPFLLGFYSSISASMSIFIRNGALLVGTTSSSLTILNDFHLCLWVIVLSLSVNGVLGILDSL